MKACGSPQVSAWLKVQFWMHILVERLGVKIWFLCLPHSIDQIPIDSEPYWYYEYLIQEPNTFRHYVASTAERDGRRPPWVGLGAAVWVQIEVGNSYNFPLYSSRLKFVLGCSQQQVTILGVANDIRENVGPLPGYVCNKFPPWVVLCVGAVFCFLDVMLIWEHSANVDVLSVWCLRIN
ncbi:Nodulin-like [Dillenia turbinata]|uniref:Nodulin-like n=1 Tax=Dillenia turbinata TaxID=194707 RepID=A0AAN8ZUK8_9MAGN